MQRKVGKIMALYNDTVMEHFLNPKNVGEIENPDGKGIYGSPMRSSKLSDAVPQSLPPAWQLR